MTSIMTSANNTNNESNYENNNNINNMNMNMNMNTDPDTEDTTSTSSNGDNDNDSNNNDNDSNGNNNNNGNNNSDNNSINDPISVADTLLANGLNALSFQDRNNINEEMHGVSCLAIKETPEMILNSIEKLQIEIDTNIPNKNKQAYIQSQTLYNQGQGGNGNGNGNGNASNNNLNYVNSFEFRLLFLRCELFDIPKSALKLVNYLNVVLELFGIYALQRPIRLSDFTESELHIFRMGNLQLLPFRVSSISSFNVQRSKADVNVVT